MLQGYTMAIVPCGNPTPKKLPTGGGEWPTFRTARAQRAHSARYAPLITSWDSLKLSIKALSQEPFFSMLPHAHGVHQKRGGREKQANTT